MSTRSDGPHHQEGGEVRTQQTGPTRPDPDLRREAARGRSGEPPKVSGVSGGVRDLSGTPDDEVTAAADKTGAGPNGGASH